MSTISLKSIFLALSMLVLAGCPSTQQVKEEGPTPPRNLLGSTDELQLVTELLTSLASEHGTDSILVVLAIDDTLLNSYRDTGPCGPDTGLESDDMPTMVQPDTATQVQRMQGSGVKVIALSGKQAECAEKVAAELSHNDIDFSASAWPFQDGFSGEFVPEGASRPVSYQNGVLLASGQDKGKMLEGLLLESGAKPPSLIVMVDHRQQDLGEVMKAFAFSGTKVHAWRYTRVETAQN